MTCDVKNAGATMRLNRRGARHRGPQRRRFAVAAKSRCRLAVWCVPHAPAIINWYARFLNGPQVKPLTPLQKAHLAARNLIDPFNILTIFGEAGISVAANSHSVYGPGLFGWAKESGVSFTQDLTGEFFGTF